MATFEDKFKAEMILMEGKELRFASNMPGEDKIELCEAGIEYLQRCVEDMKKHPENHTEDEGSKFQLRIELCKLTKDYFKDMGL